MANTKTFSLYLGKPSVSSLEDLLTESARDMLKHGPAKKIVSAEFADDSAPFVFPGYPAVPKWIKGLAPVFDVAEPPLSQSPCGVIAFKKDERFFAITFSYGHVYLNESAIESDFGLKAAVNAVNDTKIRSVERSNLGAAIREFAQAAGQKELRAFGFDEALDLIRKVSGSPSDGNFASNVTGSKALRFTRQMELTDVPGAAVEALKLFEKDAYKATSFKIIDFLFPVLDPVVSAALDDELVKAIKDGTDEFEIAIPEILGTGVGSFRFENAGFGDFHVDLTLEIYRDGLGSNIDELTASDLKKHKVAAYSEAGDAKIDQWSVRNALIGTIVMDGTRYALNEGLWYRLDEAFKDAAEAAFKDRFAPPDPKFTPLKKIAGAKAKGKKQKIHYQSEESYNEEAAGSTGYLLMDRKLIEIADEPGRGIEACDLLDIDGRRFIHVKKSSRQSSVLSHFFKQGSNSAQMLRKYEPFRTALVEKVAALHGQPAADKLKAALNEKWTVEFQIADTPRNDGSYNIPFFSKLTLRDAAREMEAMQFDVRIRFIKLAPP